MKRKIIAISVLLVIAIVFVSTLVGCNNLEPKGKFYSLQQAYDDGLITVEDLQSIACYLCNWIDCSEITPTPKNPETLDEKTVSKIKNDSLIKLLAEKDKDGRQLYPKATTKDIYVKYYGTYNDMIAVVVENGFVGYADVILEDVIGGVTFIYSGPFPILWKDNTATDQPQL